MRKHTTRWVGLLLISATLLLAVPSTTSAQPGWSITPNCPTKASQSATCKVRISVGLIAPLPGFRVDLDVTVNATKVAAITLNRNEVDATGALTKSVDLQLQAGANNVLFEVFERTVTGGELKFAETSATIENTASTPLLRLDPPLVTPSSFSRPHLRMATGVVTVTGVLTDSYRVRGTSYISYTLLDRSNHQGRFDLQESYLITQTTAITITARSARVCLCDYLRYEFHIKVELLDPKNMVVSTQERIFYQDNHNPRYTRYLPLVVR